MRSFSRARRGAPVVVALAALAVTPTFDRSDPAAALAAHSGQDHPENQGNQGSQDLLSQNPVTPSGPDQLGAPLLTQPAHPPLAVTPPASSGTPGSSTKTPKHSPAKPPASISQLTSSGIPQVALLAYHNAATDLQQSAPGCHLPWALLAGIGRVESDQGQFGGAALQADGNESKPIVGPALDGAAAGMARIDDTDQGRYDGDKSYDRAVGPMQFLPSTWSAVGVDADSNGIADPQNIFDAAASAGVYLCAGGADLSTPAGQQAAVLRYNHSQSYVDLVLGLMRAYAAGESGTVLPDATHPIAPPNQITPPPVTTDERDRQAQQAKHHRSGATKTKTKTVTKKKTTTKRRTPAKKPPTKTTPPPVHVPPRQPIKPPVQPTPPAKAPSAPQGVHTDPVMAAAGPALELEWTSPKNVGSGVAGYKVNVTSATGKPVIDPLSAGKAATALTLPDLPDGGVYTVSITAWSARGKQQATSAPASLAVATLDPTTVTGTAADKTVATTWDWDATANKAITPTGFIVRVVNADGTTAVEQQAKADERSATLTLPDGADPTKVATVEVWATFSGATGLAGVTEPAATPVKAAEPPPSDTPTATPTSTPSSSPSSPASSTPTPSGSATPSK